MSGIYTWISVLKIRRRLTVKVQCKGCRIGFNIPDDKVPEGKVLKILCPKCKEPVEISEKAIPTELDGRVPYLSGTLKSEYDDDSRLGLHKCNRRSRRWDENGPAVRHRCEARRKNRTRRSRNSTSGSYMRCARGSPWASFIIIPTIL